MSNDAGPQALRDYELKHDMRGPWETGNENLKESRRKRYRELEACFAKFGLQIVALSHNHAGEVE